MREFRRLRDAGLPVTSEVRARHVWATNDGYATGPDVGHRIPGFALPDQWGDPNFKRPLRPEDRAHTEFLKVIRRRQCPIIALGLARFRDRHVVGVISEQPGEGPRAIAQIREVHVRKWWRWMLASFAPHDRDDVARVRNSGNRIEQSRVDRTARRASSSLRPSLCNSSASSSKCDLISSANCPSFFCV